MLEYVDYLIADGCMMFGKNYRVKQFLIYRGIKVNYISYL